MTEHTKLRSDTTAIRLGGFLATLLILVILWIKFSYDRPMEMRFFGAFWSIAAIVQLLIWARTGNSGYLLWMLTCLAIALSYLTNYKGLYFLLPLIGLLITYFFFIATRRMRWRYRDILELAAAPVDETADGFTPRPFPAGSATYTQGEMAAFGKFLSKQLIAFPFYENGRTILVINTSGGLFFRKPHIHKDTFVCFDADGNVSTNITQKDYQRFRDELTFAQLCESLGNLFKDFLARFQAGEQNTIVALTDKQTVVPVSADDENR